MKKILIASGVAVLAFASVAAAQTFSTNLTVGSTGADVAALQTWLNTNGFSIPAIASGVATPGYFGSQTKMAVQKYQTSKGIPSTGFVGPLTRAALNGTASVASVPSSACPVGYTCTPVAGAPVGTPVVSGSITTPGIAGTLAVSLQGSPSGASLDKGEAEDVARYKLQAAASDEQVTSISLDFDTRLWLIAGSVTIKDDSGAVVAQKSGLTANDFTELTVGSSYRLYVPVNYIVPKAATRYFTINVTMLPISDRSAATVTIGQAQVRAVDGTGVSDTQTVGDDRTFSYTGSNTGSVIATLNANSPLKRLVQISNSTKTEGVVLAKFDLKSQNRDAVLRTLKVYINTDGTSVNTLFTRFQIQAGSMTYTANTTNVDTLGNTTSSSTLTFTDLNIPLAKDVYTTVTVLGDVAQPSSTGALDGKSASSTIKANTTNVAAEDSTYNTVSVNTTTLTGSDITVSASGAILSAMSATLGSPVLSNNVTVAQPVSFTYTITAGDNTLYVAAAPTTALATTTSGYGTAANASSTLTSVTATPSEVAGDSTGVYFVVPAGGSRTFKWSGSISNDPPRGVVQRTFYVTKVYYDTNTTNLNDNYIDYNLGALKVEPVI